jgi:hypothetical protein
MIKMYNMKKLIRIIPIVVLVLLLIIPQNALAQTQLPIAYTTSANSNYALNMDNGFYGYNKLFLAYPDSSTNGRINILIWNTTNYYTLANNQPIISIVEDTGFSTHNYPYIYWSGYNSTHVLLSVLYTYTTFDTAISRNRFYMYGYPYLINVNTLQITALTSFNNNPYSPYGSRYYISVFTRVKQTRIYYFILVTNTDGGGYPGIDLFLIAYYDVSAQTFTILTQSTYDWSDNGYFTTIALTLDGNFNWIALFEAKTTTGKYYRWIWKEGTNTLLYANLTSTNSICVYDVNNQLMSVTIYNYYVTNYDYFYYYQNVGDTVQYSSNNILSFYDFDSYLQSYEYIQLDISGSSNSAIKQTIINLNVGYNLLYGGYPQSFNGTLKQLTLYYPNDYTLKLVTYNVTNNSLYNDTSYSTYQNGGFVFRLDNSGFFITKGSSPNTLYIYGNSKTIPVITITSTQTNTGGSTGGSTTVIVSPTNTIDLVSLALGIIVFLFPVGVIYEYTKNGRISMIFGLAIGTVLGSLLGIIPLWLLVIIGLALGIYLFTNMGRGE